MDSETKFHIPTQTGTKDGNHHIIMKATKNLELLSESIKNQIIDNDT
jgi:hypothetical protein